MLEASTDRNSACGNAPKYEGEPVNRAVQWIAGLEPAYFAAVMATGIVSIACYDEGWNRPAIGLTWLNIAGFAVLVGLNLIRIFKFPLNVWHDLTDHNRGVGFFTLAAAVCVLGAQFRIIADVRFVAIGLWALGIGVWFLLTYFIFASLAVKEEKPTLPAGIHGGWLVSVVAAQSVSVLGGLLATEFLTYQEPVLFFCLIMWLSGGMLYAWIISLIFYRCLFFKMSSADLGPADWINMGAMAISTLAGATLISVAGESKLLNQRLPFLKWWNVDVLGNRDLVDSDVGHSRCLETWN